MLRPADELSHRPQVISSECDDLSRQLPSPHSQPELVPRGHGENALSGSLEAQLDPWQVVVVTDGEDSPKAGASLDPAYLRFP